MRPTTTPSRRWRWRPQGLRRLPPPCRAKLTRRHPLLAVSRHSRRIWSTAKQRAADPLCRPASLERMNYFRLVIAVRSAENFTTPVALHQLEPNPPGLIAVTKDGLKLVVL